MWKSKMKPSWFCFALCGILYLANTSEGARILGIFPFQGFSHFVMFREISQALADQGHQVDVVSPFPLKTKYPNYTDIIDMSKMIVGVTNNMTLDYVMAMSSSGSPRAFIDFAGTQLCELLGRPEFQKLIKNPPNDPPYDLVMVEFFVAHCYFAFGRHLNVPMVALGSTPIMPHSNAPLGNPTSLAFVKQFGANTGEKLSFWERLKNTIGVTAMSLGMTYFIGEQTEIVKKYFHAGMPPIAELERDISLLLINSHHSLFGIRPLTPAIVEVAGVHVKDDGKKLPADVKKWLDESRDGFVYISFGSMLKIESFPRATLDELYSAFKKIQPIRVFMKIAKPEEMPPGIPDNVMTVSWASQVKVLKHENIKAFVTHGGLMGLQEAITCGVPLIGIPTFADQPENVNICVQRGVAVSIDKDNITAENFVAAVNTVVKNPSYRINMKKFSDEFLDRPMTARDTSVYWIEYILRHGSDALRSPATRMSWWELALLDVYAALISGVLLVLYIVKWILFALIRRVCRKSAKTEKNKKFN